MGRIIEVKVGGNYLSKDNNNAGVQHEANVTALRIEFDDGWDGYAKKVTFWDSKGENPVERTLTVDMLEDITKSTRIYLCLIPGEALAEAGWCTFVIDGYVDGKRQRSISAKLCVKDSPFQENAGEPSDPTPTQAEQLQSQIDDLLPKIVLAGQVAENETERILAESVRTAAEQDRSAAEQKRLEEERNRISNEEARQSAESGRTVEEAKRVTAEQNRITAEQARAAAETQRIAAETDRQSKSSAMQVWEEYDSARAYVPLNKVVLNGSSYICIQACTGVLPENGNYWLMIARKGVDGTTVSASGQYSFAVENGHLILYYTGETPPDFTIDENGHLILHFDDTHTMDIGAVIGPPGPAGPGVPAGGTAGQVLTKSSDEDYATEWKNASAGGGLSSDEKAKILSLFKSAAYTADMSTVITQLETLWSGSSGDSGGESGGGESETAYTVTNNLTNVTTSNVATSVEAGGSYSANLTVADGNVLNSIIVTMGGVDITADAYGDGYLLIAEVTGNIVITAVAGKTVLYQLADTPKSVSGLSEDTGITFGSADANGYTKALSICVAYTGFDRDETLMKMSSGSALCVSTNGAGGNGSIRVTACSNVVGVYPSLSDTGDYRVVITKAAKVERTIKVYTLSSGEVSEASCVGTYGTFFSSVCAGNLLVGDSDITVSDLAIYEGILSSADIETFLNGGDI